MYDKIHYNKKKKKKEKEKKIKVTTKFIIQTRSIWE